VVASQKVGAAVTSLRVRRGVSAFRRKIHQVGGAVLTLLLVAAPVAASERFALIVTGAHGEASYADQYARWRQTAVTAMLEKLDFGDANILTLFEGGDTAHAATAAGVRRSLDTIRAKMSAGDVLLVFLIGHGSFDGSEAKFNLVGPDLSSTEWAVLLKPIPGKVVVVNSTAASFPFLEHLAGPRRIVITATDSVAQRFDTVFPEYFIRALTDAAADIDKNGRVSVWEAFTAASMGVRRYYTQRGQLATERALIDDDGDGVGREAGGDGKDGSASSRLYFDPEVVGAAPTDEALLQLLQKRTALQIEVDDLKQRRQLMTPDEYQKEFEKVMLDLARVSRDIRARQKT
jgi:chorismate mutase